MEGAFSESAYDLDWNPGALGVGGKPRHGKPGCIAASSFYRSTFVQLGGDALALGLGLGSFE